MFLVPTATERVLTQRLATQRLTSAPFASAAEAVDLLTCVQSQEREHALFSLGLRTRAATLAGVRAELDAGAFLRTHILRPTWHFVRPDDLRWILALTSPRVERSMAARHRELDLDDPRYVAAAVDAVAELLAGGNHLTRGEIGALQHPRLPPAGPPLGHLLLVAELRGVICSGASRGANHTYALVDEWVPPTPALDADEALARLVSRFFAGHGPASAHDFARWSSLTVGDARRGVELVGDRLERVEVDGTPLWFDPAARARRRASAPAAWLLPTYDEVVLTYPALTFPAASGHPHSAADDPFWARVVCGTVNVGMWKRTVARDGVTVDVRLAGSADADVRKSVREAAQRLADFVGRPLEYVEGDGTPPLWGGRPSARGRR
jgi:hypothetical protein